MQILTATEVKAAARDYHARGLLTAQHSDPLKRLCASVVDGKYRCAVAAAYSEKTMAKLNPDAGIYDMVRDRLIRMSDQDDPVIRRIQWVYSTWCIESRDHGAGHRTADNVRRTEQAFLATIAEAAPTPAPRPAA